MNTHRTYSTTFLGWIVTALAAVFVTACSSTSMMKKDDSSVSNTSGEAAAAEAAAEEVITVTGFRGSRPTSKKNGRSREDANPNDTGEIKERIKHRLDKVWRHRHAHQIFNDYGVNPTITTRAQARSTFAIDVDDGSYKLALKMLDEGYLPAEAGIRVEEFVNAMDYNYLNTNDIFSLSAESMPSPFRQGYHVLHLGIQGKEIGDSERRPINLVLVADVSGSMQSDNKLQLLKQAFLTLCAELKKGDYVALVSYDDRAKVVLSPTNANKRRKIASAIRSLETGGSTNVEAGLKLAHKISKKMYQPGLNNRILFSSDGMANVGASSAEGILESVSRSRNQNIYISTVGVGFGMYNDALLEQLANKGNGQYLYVGSQKDIRSTFVDKFASNMQTIAKDVKTQVVFNPEVVSHFRLLGYENRKLKNQDFLDPTKDGGEIGAGHRVTALYEIKFKGAPDSQDIAEFRIAYKKPEGEKVYTLEKPIPQEIVKSSYKTSSFDLRLSSSAAAFAEKLRNSYWSQSYDYSDIKYLIKTLPRNYVKERQVDTLLNALAKAARIDDREPKYSSENLSQTFDLDNVPLLK